MTQVREDRAALFSNLQSRQIQAAFFARVADDVDWAVQGTHPLAGRYRGKKAFMGPTFDRSAGVLPESAGLRVDHLFVDGNTTIAELVADSRTNEGAGSITATAGCAGSTVT
ncbi:hypothetical protein ACNPQM_41850 [Streptomyces sp. NPDC056231]|uniref:hypothetical protein n=1 Tax=Streptomyces sp. NPDC056231 TaxID=3345755 RepID=UPI003AAB49A2